LKSALFLLLGILAAIAWLLDVGGSVILLMLDACTKNAKTSLDYARQTCPLECSHSDLEAEVPSIISASKYITLPSKIPHHFTAVSSS
jgi:hypothetical protein